MAAVVVAVALADTVANNLDNSIEATAETMSLQAGGADGSVSFHLQPTNGDAKNGCNLTGSASQLVATVSSSNPSVATVGSSSVTLTACDGGADPTTWVYSSPISIHPVGIGSSTVTLSFSSVTTTSAATTASDYNFAPATFTVSVVCPAGKYDNGTGCVPADPGHYVPSAGATSQIPCAVGTYQPSSGATSCLVAPAGSFVNVTGAVAATSCLVGTFQPSSGSASCLVAPAGYFVSVTGAVAATPCPVGRYQPSAGSASCLLAPPGSFVNVTGAVAATLCPVGHFQPSPGSVSCLLAPPGSYVDITGALAYEQCEPGSYQPNAGSASCILADPGFFVGTAGATSQTPCPTDTTSLVVGATECAPLDTTPPVISYVLTPSTPDGDNGWYTSDITLVWTVTEAESPGSLVTTGCVDQSITADQAATSYSCAAESDGGSAVPVTVSIKRDATKPTISVSHTADGLAGWNVTDPVSVSIVVDDATSGVAGPPTCKDGVNPLTVTGSASPYTASVTGEGIHDISCTVDDGAGNTSDPGTDEVKIDTVEPTISAAATTSPNAAGWYKTSVTVAFTCADSGSGGAVAACPADEVLSTEGSAVSSTARTVKDIAGNESEPSNVVTVKIDKTNPLVAIVGGPTGGGSYYFGFVPAAPTCSASDVLSGLDGSCTVTGYSTAVGSHTVTATAKDKAGNTSATELTYTVLAWTLNGFYQPVDMNGVFNVVKNGSTVPLKFEIFAGTTELTDTAYVKSLNYGLVACNADAPNDDIETVATGGTTLRYDSTAGQYVYNWKTPTTAGKCYSVTLTTLDGSKLSAFFRLK